ncbi:MAG: hypothetical protein CBB71_14195 [Rhodopirellula sp. TMED11]|nr:MAG: hypothetical protein CBB71_14195 [Rhodopirellula sp. TMED11]
MQRDSHQATNLSTAAARTGPPIGLIAGWGSFPIEVAEHVTNNGRDVYCVAIKDHASEQLESICSGVRWSGVGKIGAHIRFFKRQGVEEVTMAGKLFKSDLLFQGSLILKHLPDWTAIRTFAPALLGRRPDARDDNLLLAVTNTYQRHHMKIAAATDLAPQLLISEGVFCGKTLSSKQQQDADFGWQVAKQMGGMDIGQSITVKDSTILAVEAVEGTDQCIERTGQLCRRGGWMMVKVSKPEQDMRFDVPTIGPQTVQRVHEGGGTAIVVEADKTIVVEQQETAQMAKQLGITIVAVRDQHSAQESQQPPHQRSA